MRKIVEIIRVEGWTKDGKEHTRTTAMLDNQNEAMGYGWEYKVGDEVEAWWNDEWDYYQMQHPKIRRK